MDVYIYAYIHIDGDIKKQLLKFYIIKAVIDGECQTLDVDR